MADTNPKRIPLGSGKLYSAEYTGNTVPADEEIETAANQLGYITGGASIEYKAEYVEIKDDYEEINEVLLKDDSATFKADILTHLGYNFEAICNTANIIAGDNGEITVKIGGAGNFEFEKRVFRFVHDDAKNGDVRITIVGYNSNGFTLSYKKAEAGAVGLEIKALAADSSGTKIIYKECAPDASA